MRVKETTTMSNTVETNTSADPWDTGELGRSEEFVKRAPAELQEEIDTALALQMISVRLKKETIKDMKAIAEYRGVGYQPLIRDVLAQFVRAELALILREMQEQKKAREALAEQLAERKRA
jgi:predicted DNA binding CopG/RHH family protein